MTVSSAALSGLPVERLLYVQEAVAAESGRGLGSGRFFTRDHQHLATVAQEGMIRAA